MNAFGRHLPEKPRNKGGIVREYILYPLYYARVRTRAYAIKAQKSKQKVTKMVKRKQEQTTTSKDRGARYNARTATKVTNNKLAEKNGGRHGASVVFWRNRR